MLCGLINIIRDAFRTRLKTMETKDVLMVVGGVENKIGQPPRRSQ